MARPLRIQYPGAMYHIISRGNGGNDIFLTDMDYRIFLDEFKKTIEYYNWISFAYCLMPNHYHLFIQTVDPNLSIGMRQLNGNYTQKSNILNNRRGHLFQDRFKSILVEDAGYQGNLVRYIALNPIKAGLAQSLLNWKWSSHKEIIGKKKQTGCVHTDRTLSFFHEDKKQAKVEYLKYLREKSDKEDTWKDLRAGMILGSLDFAKKVMRKYGKSKSLENIKRERFLGRPELEKIFTDKMNKRKRDRLIFKAYKEYGYTQADIAKHLDMHYTTISRIIKVGKEGRL